MLELVGLDSSFVEAGLSLPASLRSAPSLRSTIGADDVIAAGPAQGQRRDRNDQMIPRDGCVVASPAWSLVFEAISRTVGAPVSRTRRASSF
jgi:hypothetical protein